MKKLALTIALISTMALGANAQRDAFVTWDDNEWERYDNNGIAFTLPSMHGSSFDDNAPLGSGLLVLTILGAGYATKRRHNN